MKFEFPGQIFEISPNMKFNENQAIVKRVVPYGQMDGRTDRHVADNSCNSQFSENG